MDPGDAPGLLVGLAAVVFLGLAGWRVLLVLVSGRTAGACAEPVVLPRYTILAALHDEAPVVGQLIERLSRIDYPSHRLQGLLVLEAHDHATIAAALATPRPSWLQVFVAPPGAPLTKPRALNCALGHATGDLLTVYDAEDEPDPRQLREAAAKFAADRTGRLACLQAPLRIRSRSARAATFIERQFAAEYAALFETTLPGMCRLGLPFPLGGTSNHFRTNVLREVGGWDVWNVTEDADLGFRLWRRGWRLDVIHRPTWETSPGSLQHWLPQRTRWLKGYMQTFGVHSRRAWRLGPRGLFSLFVTVGAGLVSAAVHGPSLAWLAATVLVSSVAGLPPLIPLLALGVLIVGAASAWLSCWAGAKRAGVAYTLVDAVSAPAYWALLSLAWVHAAWRLIREPFAWDKTAHRPDAPEACGGATPARAHAMLDETAPNRLSAGHAAAPQPVA
ncbi:glycosyltransferase family 2 protein [Brevundimonas sp.]|uniref:glycosyltransferase family 2 protein n=1 Tax=Brevundimonas sp. TaxID=1871086 RepID=UPI002D58B27D|nr:glycosyltransferase family 2 protein [Brevundimonas sp.]HYC66719.1 glycosyltransferase family 2 protein [Brevundimonas sp.]